MTADKMREEFEKLRPNYNLRRIDDQYLDAEIAIKFELFKDAWQAATAASEARIKELEQDLRDWKESTIDANKRFQDAENEVRRVTELGRLELGKRIIAKQQLAELQAKIKAAVEQKHTLRQNVAWKCGNCVFTNYGEAITFSQKNALPIEDLFTRPPISSVLEQQLGAEIEELKEHIKSLEWQTGKGTL